MSAYAIRLLGDVERSAARLLELAGAPRKTALGQFAGALDDFAYHLMHDAHLDPVATRASNLAEQARRLGRGWRLPSATEKGVLELHARVGTFAADARTRLQRAAGAVQATPPATPRPHQSPVHYDSIDHWFT